MTQLMREAVEALRQFIEEKVNYMRINHLGDPEKTHTVKYGRIALSHLTEELRRQDAFDVKEAERALQWAIRAARNGVQITEHERIEAQCALMSMLNLLDGAAAAQALHTDQAGSEGGGKEVGRG